VAITRLGLANPTANTPTAIATFTSPYLVSITACNKSSDSTVTLTTTVYVVPNNAVQDSQYGYVCYNVAVGVGQAYETFRFAVNSGDTVYVRASTDNCSFTCNGVPQTDAGLPENTVQALTNKEIRGVYNTLYLDKGLTSQRPASAEVGYVRFNTEFDKLEVKTSTGWKQVGWA
jgi:co-chaperonin GroES (HSP10)